MQRPRAQMHTIRIGLTVAVMVLSAGCRDDLLVGVGSDVSVSPDRIDFGQRWVGHPHLEPVTLTNRSRVAHDVAVEVSGPFFVEQTELELGGGAELTLAVRFAPEHPGAHEGLLVVTVDGRTRELPLVGSAQLPPECSQTNPCTNVAFDPVLGECVASVAADGTACDTGTACVEAGECKSGVCVGAALDCDDGNPCTLDACDAATGCVNLDASDQCPAPTNPCEVSFCDPITGCGITSAMDGIACGPADCVTARVCMSGACKTVPVPNGRECAPESPCQGKGVCVDQVCQRPPAGVLNKAWTVGPIHELRFDGVADDQDNVYWAECTGAMGGCTGSGCPPCFAVSVDRDGVERWRQQLVLVRGTSAAPYQQMLTAGVLVTFVGRDVLEGRDPADGRLLWWRDLNTDYASIFFDATVPQTDRQIFFGQSSADAVGNLYVPMVFGNIRPGGPEGALLVALDATTGQTRWTRQLVHHLPETVADELGNVYLGESVYRDAAPNFMLTSFAHNGSVRWMLPVDDAQYLAVNGGVLVAGGQTAYQTSNGIQQWTHPLGTRRPLVLAGGSAWTLNWIQPKQSYELVRRDAQLGTPLWSSDLGPKTFVDGMTLTTQDAVLMVASRPSLAPTSTGNTWAVTEVDSAGNPSFTCELPTPVNFAWRMTLLRDRVVLQLLDTQGSGWSLTAFDLHGRSLRQSGWVNEGGSNARRRSPR